MHNFSLTSILQLQVTDDDCKGYVSTSSSSTYLISVGKFTSAGQKASKVAFVKLNKCH